MYLLRKIKYLMIILLLLGCANNKQNAEHLMLKSLISDDVVVIEIYSEHGKLVERIEGKEKFKIIENWLNSSSLPKAIASYYTPIYRMDFIYTKQVKRHINFGGDKEYSTIEFIDTLYIADRLPDLISNDYIGL